jgi:murein L,D-transpeptidase YafK
VQDVLDLYGPAAEQRLVPYFYSAGVPYPPAVLAFLGFKAEHRLEVWARHQDAWVFIRAYAIEAASGTAGPKLRQGDYQVPEGLYTFEALNPNSRFHLSLKLDYPNAADRQQAALEGRDQLGGDIFLHGKDVSVGCLAMGDVAIEELFVLVARTGLERVIVLLAPYDFRQRAVERDSSRPAWVEALYKDLHRELGQFTRTPP